MGPDDCVEDEQQLVHAGNECDFWALAGSDQARMERGKRGVVSHADQCAM
jgi:hypothetical protein